MPTADDDRIIFFFIFTHPSVLPPNFHKQHGKGVIVVRYYTQYHKKSLILWIPPFVNSMNGIDFAMLFTLKTTWKARGLQTLRSQGIAVDYYGFTLDAWL
jgi:hypothetical protein